MTFKKGSSVFLQLFQKYASFYLRQYDHLEIQDFVFPDNLDLHAAQILKEYQKLLQDFQGTLSLHGPFKELNLSSMDPQVHKLALKRLCQALLCGKDLGCSTLVVHSCYNPLQNYPDYEDNWVENAVPFWEQFLPFCEQHNIRVVLENIWDRTPRPIQRLVDHFQSPLLKACLDTGHAHISSRLRLEEWTNILGENLAHIHLHDNFGDLDQHFPAGQGSIDFSWLAKLKERENIPIVNEAYGFLEEENCFLDFMLNYD